MNHKINIGFCKKPDSNAIVSWRTVTMRERLLRLLLGERESLMVIVPSGSVKEMDIQEIGGESDEAV